MDTQLHVLTVLRRTLVFVEQVVFSEHINPGLLNGISAAALARTQKQSSWGSGPLCTLPPPGQLNTS
jgi:hypothetical protein